MLRSAATFFFALVICPSLASATDPIRACFDWHSDSNGPLPRKDVDNVKYRPISFMRAGLHYDVETFSDMGPVAAEHCFRWEIVNNSRSPNLVIDQLTWPVAGIRVSRMKVGEEYLEYSNIRDRLQPLDVSNPVYAFENEMKPTQSWRTSVPDDRSVGGKEAVYKFLKTKDILPGLSSVDKSILDSLVALISFGEGRSPPPEIHQVVGYGKLAIRVVSRVLQEGSALVITTSAVVSNPPSSETRFGFPALTALQETQPKAVGDPKDADRFLQIFGERLKFSESNRTAWNVGSTVAPNPGGATVFRIRQPVVVTSGDERHCYLVATYTPIPIGLSLQNCW